MKYVPATVKASVLNRNRPGLGTSFFLRVTTKLRLFTTGSVTVPWNADSGPSHTSIFYDSSLLSCHTQGQLQHVYILKDYYVDLKVAL